MKLHYRITLNVSLVLFVLFAVWSVMFYYIIIDEINDEMDDSLEHYSEYIITRALAGETLPEKENGTNNSYYITEVDNEYAKTKPSAYFLDEMIYLQSRRETEPARIYKTVFKDSNDRFFELTVMMPTIEKDDLKQTILLWITILYLALFISILVVNILVLHRSLKPLYTMLDWLDELSLKKVIPSLKIKSGVSEFNKLSEALLHSAKRNAEVYEQQSLFIGHASHELQTPIAVAQNRLEILADDTSLTEQQLLQILKTKQSLSNISSLNKTLLLLTKIENKQFPDNEEIDLNEILASLSDDFSEAYEHQNIDCKINNNKQIRILMNPTLASVLFSNLIKNAYVHNEEGGQIIITIDSDSLVFSNTATSGALNPEYIFQRFYQGTRREGSVGLGLSLVESICKMYDLKISYSYENSFHHFILSPIS